MLRGAGSSDPGATMLVRSLSASYPNVVRRSSGSVVDTSRPARSYPYRMVCPFGSVRGSIIGERRGVVVRVRAGDIAEGIHHRRDQAVVVVRERGDAAGCRRALDRVSGRVVLGELPSTGRRLQRRLPPVGVVTDRRL